MGNVRFTRCAFSIASVNRRWTSGLERSRRRGRGAIDLAHRRLGCRIALARAVQGVSAAVAGVATSPGGVDLRGDHPPVRRRRRLGVVRGRRCAGRAPIRAGAIRPQADVAGAAASLIASSLSADVPPERNAMNEVEESPRGLFVGRGQNRGSPAQDSELGLALREGPDRGPACAAGSRPLGGRLRPLQPGDPVLAWRDRGPTGIDGPAARWELMRE
jgi:hypothetical protein